MKVIEIEIPIYNPKNGFVYNWENDFNIETKIKDGEIKIIANREGLTSLANHLLNLAQDGIPSGFHLHFDEYNALEEGSVDLIIEKE